MKKILIASVVFLTVASCSNDANDGSTATDTTNFNTVPETSSAPLGDTSRDVNNDGTQTNLNSRTDIDTAGDRNSGRDTTTGGSARP